MVVGGGGYLASSSRGVAFHLVVRVVVTALESVLQDATDSKDNKDAHARHILNRVPVRKKSQVNIIVLFVWPVVRPANFGRLDGWYLLH